MAHKGQPTPDFGLCFQIEVLETFVLGFQVKVLETGSHFVLHCYSS